MNPYDTSIYWSEADEINFYLFNLSLFNRHQNSFLNNYTIYESGSAQEYYCNTIISKNFWAYNQTYCKSGYTYQFALNPTINSNQTCYLISGFTIDKIKGQYEGLSLFDNCGTINGTAFDDYIIKYWTWAYNSYNFESSLKTILSSVSSQFSYMNNNVSAKISKVSQYYSALSSAYTEIQNLYTVIELYYSIMNCSMVYDLTKQLYVGFCGEILEFLFYLSIFSGILGFFNMCLSLGIIFFLFRFRTDLEIEQERMMRTIGRPFNHESKDEELTQRAEDTTVVNKP